MSKGATLGRSSKGLLSMVITVLIVLAVGSFVVQSPTEAANVVTTAWDWFMTAVDAIRKFLSQIFG